MRFIRALITTIGATAIPTHARIQSVMVSTSSPPQSTATPPVDPSQIGTFSLADLNGTDPANNAFLTRHEDELLVNRTVQVRHGSKLRRLSTGEPIDVSANVNGTLENIDSFMQKYGIAGLIIVQDGAIRAEKYQYGNMAASRNVIQSCTKSLISTVLGVAIADGEISLSDTASKYVPEMADTPYGDVPLRNLVHMTSGVAVPAGVPDYFDVYRETDPDAVFELFKAYEKVAEPGQVFNYLDQNYYVISVALSRAVREPIQTYVTRKIWKPAGMQYDGYMRATGAGQVDGHGGLAITLADMARFGLFVLDSINCQGGPRVPAGWFDSIAEASTSTGIRAPGAINAAPNFGYQTGWWTLPRGGENYALGDDRAFTALGTYDQAIYIIPGLNATIAMQSSYPVHTPELFSYGQEFATAVALAMK